VTAPAFKKSRPEKVEKIYAELVKAGLVRIVRRRGKPPQIVWLSQTEQVEALLDVSLPT
jgi:hypothetical protein